jgi:hypothetical protein
MEAFGSPDGPLSRSDFPRSLRWCGAIAMLKSVRRCLSLCSRSFCDAPATKSGRTIFSARVYLRNMQAAFAMSTAIVQVLSVRAPWRCREPFRRAAIASILRSILERVQVASVAKMSCTADESHQ